MLIEFGYVSVKICLLIASPIGVMFCFFLWRGAYQRFIKEESFHLIAYMMMNAFVLWLFVMCLALFEYIWSLPW